MIAGLQNLLFALIAGLVIGSAGGYYTKYKFDKADQVTVLEDQRKDDVATIKEAVVQEKTLQAKVETTRNTNTTIRAEIKKYEKTVSEIPAKQESVSQCVFPTLSFGTVSLLNAARENRLIDPASWGDGKGETPTAATTADLIDNDLEVVGIYLDLAQRHNALVDWAEKEVQKHNSQINSGK